MLTGFERRFLKEPRLDGPYVYVFARRKSARKELRERKLSIIVVNTFPARTESVTFENLRRSGGKLPLTGAQKNPTMTTESWRDSLMKLRENRTRLVICAVVMNLFVLHDLCVCAHSAEYTIHDLGLQGFEPQRPRINDLGQAAIYFQSAVSNASRFEFGDPSAFIDVLPLFPDGAALNDAGELLGLIPTADPLEFQLQLIQNGNSHIVGSVARQLDRVNIVSYNDVGEFVGVHYTEYLNNVRTFIGSVGGPERDIGNLGSDFTLATDINNSGRAVGFSHTGATAVQVASGRAFEEAFVYDQGGIRGIGTLGGAASYAYAINDLNQVVGESSTADHRLQAFFYDSSLGMQNIGRPGLDSYALDINNNSNVVGVELDDAGKMHAFLHDDINGLRWLENLISPDSGWTTLREADGINNLGQIVGIGTYNGETRAFLLTPIPEPSTILLLTIVPLATGRRFARR